MTISIVLTYCYQCNKGTDREFRFGYKYYCDIHLQETFDLMMTKQNSKERLIQEVEDALDDPRRAEMQRNIDKLDLEQVVFELSHRNR